MTKKPQPLTSVLRELNKVGQLKHERVEAQPLDPRLAMLKAWQARRLARTYADLLEMPRYRLACQFFLEDLYAPRDFSQRDRDVTEMYAFMQRFVPEGLLRPLTETIALYDLTRALDERLLEVLVGQVGLGDTLSEAQYVQGYRLCDNYTARVEQIEQIVEIGSLLDVIVGLPLTGTALQLAKVPARRAGWIELSDFMERGFRAFKQMHGARFFLATIRKRERQILDRIYAEEPEPFNLG